MEDNLRQVRAIVAVASAKGGSGKSSLTVNLAAALAFKGRKIGIIDADVNAPSIAAMLGMRRIQLLPMVDDAEPLSGPLGLRIVRADLRAAAQTPAAFFDGSVPLAVTNDSILPARSDENEALRQMLKRTRFGMLDVLFVDLAPGTASLLHLAGLVRLSAVLFVTQPSEHAIEALRSAVEATVERMAASLTAVENGIGFLCADCHSVRPLLPLAGTKALERDTGLLVLGHLPFDPRFAESTDRGEIFVRNHAGQPLAKQIEEIAEKLEAVLTAAESRPPVPLPSD